MALICDTGGIYAIHDADDPNHASVKFVVEVEPGQLFLPVILLAEIDYLLTTRLGVDAALDFLESLERGAFVLVSLSVEDIVRCRELVMQYRDLNVGLADASVVATAERLGIQRLLTVDQRHFRAVTPRHASHFILLPADAH
jgi:predicted nucleic acid-binding protein